MLFLLMFSFGAQAGTFQLSWSNATQRIDGTPVTDADIQSTIVQCGTAAGVYDPTMDILISKATDGTLPSSTTITVPDNGKRYYCSGYHVGLLEDNSASSNEVFFDVILSPLAPPGSVIITTTTTTVITP